MISVQQPFKISMRIGWDNLSVNEMRQAKKIMGIQEVLKVDTNKSSLDDEIIGGETDVKQFFKR